MEGHTGYVYSLAFDKNGLLASGSDEIWNNIKLWNTQTGQLIKTFSNCNYKVSSIAFNQNGLLAFGKEYSEIINLLNVQSSQNYEILWRSHAHKWIYLIFWNSKNFFIFN